VDENRDAGGEAADFKRVYFSGTKNLPRSWSEMMGATAEEENTADQSPHGQMFYWREAPRRRVPRAR
jgi:hypothetical protein